ncbi:MAG: hypothetical protein LBM59_06460 [Ruminococcus sp.]|jgi:hypothetical protein|nr:hypothetical protein [Ruminococcus sp.]
MKRKRDRQTDEVEAAILRRAVGYTVHEITLTENPETGECDRPAKVVKKDVAPNVQAALLWLKTFRPEIWAKQVGTDESEEAVALYKALDLAAGGGEEE